MIEFSHTPAFLAMRGFGIPEAPLVSMFDTLQKVKYRTKTAHGLSDITFGGDKKG